jgi:hypothetical protein
MTDLELTRAVREDSIPHNRSGFGGAQRGSETPSMYIGNVSTEGLHHLGL